jgi:hypothetical protein
MFFVNHAGACLLLSTSNTQQGQIRSLGLLAMLLLPPLAELLKVKLGNWPCVCLVPNHFRSHQQVLSMVATTLLQRHMMLQWRLRQTSVLGPTTQALLPKLLVSHLYSNNTCHGGPIHSSSSSSNGNCLKSAQRSSRHGPTFQCHPTTGNQHLLRPGLKDYAYQSQFL